MKQKIIVDTSIWIEYFKNNDQVVKIIDEGLDMNKIFIVGPVISELLQGVRSTKESELLSQYIDAVPFISCQIQDWIDAGNTSYSLRKEGTTIPLTDIIIATIAKNNQAMVFTKDKHFNLLPGVKLFQSVK